MADGLYESTTFAPSSYTCLEWLGFHLQTNVSIIIAVREISSKVIEEFLETLFLFAAHD